MGGELTKLSETRWRYAAGRRVFYIRQAKAPGDGGRKYGVYEVDGGGGDIRRVTADSVEHVAFDIRQEQLPAPR